MKHWMEYLDRFEQAECLRAESAIKENRAKRRKLYQRAIKRRQREGNKQCQEV